MQTVSETYRSIWNDPRHRKEHKAEIAGVTYGEDVIAAPPIVSRTLFEGGNAMVGNCIAGQLTLSVIPQGDIPRMAEIKLATRLALETDEQQTCSATSVGATISTGNRGIAAPDGVTYYFNVPLHFVNTEETGPVTFSRHRCIFIWSAASGMSGKSIAEWSKSDGEIWASEIELSFSTINPGRLLPLNGLTKWAPMTQYSEWLPKGTFYIDTRKLDPESGVLTIHGYDAMLKGEETFLHEGDVDAWPRTCVMLVRLICQRIGVKLDQRTTLVPAIEVPYPNDWTCREILSYIAIAHCGNWTITDAGELRLVPMWSIPEETSYLIDEKGNVITLGGVRILV